MKTQYRYALVLLAGVLIAGIVMGAGQAESPTATWEYGVYEVQVGYDRDGNASWQHFYWRTKNSTRSAEGMKFRLFCKLGAQVKLHDEHDLVLWNHLGTQGWEYVEQFQKSISKTTVHTQTVFRRRVDS